MGAIDRILRRGRLQDGGYKPLMKRLEAAMFAACRASGASAWYVPDDFLTLGPEQAPAIDSTWVVNDAGWAAVGATAVATACPSAKSFYKAGALQAGKLYYYELTVSAWSAGAVYLSFGGSADGRTFAAVGKFSGVISGAGSNGNLNLVTAGITTATVSGISVREVLSMKGFQDASGTLPTYLDGVAGILFDTAGVTGPELITNQHTSSQWTAEGTAPPTAVNGSDTYLGKSCRSVTFPVVASGGYAVSRARDSESTFTVAVGVNYTASFEYALSRDLTAGESVAIAITGSSGIYSKSVSAGAPGGVWVPATGGQPALASGAGTSLRPYATTLNAPLTVYVRALSVKVAGGNVVTQATAGNRPLVSRIPRKLGPELMTGLAISGTNATNTGSASGNGFTINQVDTSSIVGATISLPVVPTAGKSYYVTSTISGLSGYGFKVDNLAWSPAPVQATAGFVLTATSSPSPSIYIYRGSTPAAGTFSNISVREVLEWSYALTFDGNDSLAAPASIIGTNLSQPYTMIAWGRVGAVGAARAMQGDAARWIGISSSGKAIASNSGTASQIGTTTLQQGAGAIIEAVWDGAAMSVYLNGTREVNQVPTGAPITAASAHSVGQAGSAVNFWNDALGGAVVCPAVMTDAQRLAVRRFAAAQMGLAL